MRKCIAFEQSSFKTTIHGLSTHIRQVKTYFVVKLRTLSIEHREGLEHTIHFL